MANYLVENIICGALNADYTPGTAIRKAITSYVETNGGGTPVQIGTVIAKTPGYISLDITWNEFLDSLHDAGENWIGLFSKYNIPGYYIMGDYPYGYPSSLKHGSVYISPPIIVTKSYPDLSFSLLVESPIAGPVTISYYTFSDVDKDNPPNLIVLHHSRYSSQYPNTIVLGATAKGSDVIGHCWSTSIIVDSVTEVDISEPPNEARPIPIDESLLPAPSKVDFGLTLVWDDFEIKDYNVKASSENFSEGFSPINDYSGVEISADFRGIVNVTITHEIYDISADARYEVVEAGEYDPGGTARPDGGHGSYNDGESEDLRPLLPDGSAGPDTSKLGLYTRYLMTASQLRDFGDFLYADDIVDSIVNGVMKALYDSPAEAVISLMYYPFNVSSLVPTTSSNIWYGNMGTSKESSGIMSKSSCRVSWGSISLSEYWGNFLDYAPHTKIDLYLPWCVGSVPIDPHEVLPGTIQVETNIEFDKGTCIHSVFGNKGALIGTYSGVCGTQIPVTALDSSGKALNFVTAAVAGVVAAGATGGATSAGIRAANSWRTTAATAGMSFAERNEYVRGVIANAEAPYRTVARGARNTALATSAAAFRVPPSIVRNGSFSGSGASQAIQVPFVIVSRPTQSVPTNYGKYYGYPSNIYSSLGALRGYTEVGSIHLDGFSCTENERGEIAELLSQGVIL